MSGPDRLSTRDLERLSAYLDGQLPPGEAAELRARLHRDEALRQALEGLRQTRAALRSLPTLRPPRNFTLTPQMVGVRPRRQAYPVLRLATAIATVAFLFVSGVDVLTRGLRGFTFGAAAPAMLEAPSELEAAAVEEGAPAERSIAVAPTTSPPSLQAFAEDAVAPTPIPSPLGIGGGLPPGETVPWGVGGGEPLATAPSGVTFPPSKTPTPTQTPTPTATSTPTPSPEPIIVEPTAPATGAPSGLTSIQWVELLLGAAVVVFAVFSLWFRREA